MSRFIRRNRSLTHRCNYCEKDAVVRFAHMGYLAATRQKWFKTWVLACAEHEGNPNWVSVLANTPNAKLERRGHDNRFR